MAIKPKDVIGCEIRNGTNLNDSWIIKGYDSNTEEYHLTNIGDGRNETDSLKFIFDGYESIDAIKAQPRPLFTKYTLSKFPNDRFAKHKKKLYDKSK